MPPASPADRVLVALDVETLGAAERLLDRLAGTLTGCKIGSQLFTAAGPAAVEAARKRGFDVFLDLKYHDIPSTVAGAVREATRLGVAMLDVHASGGVAMMRAAAEAAARAAADFGVARPVCLGVTVLTSLDRTTLHREVGVPAAVEAHVLRLAERAQEAGLDGCVASPQEVRPLRLALGRAWVIVTPGIRPGGVERGAEPVRVPDRRSPPLPAGGVERGGEPVPAPDRWRAPRPTDGPARVATPRAALAAGADYLVVGRPITGAADPAAAAAAIVRDLGAP